VSDIRLEEYSGLRLRLSRKDLDFMVESCKVLLIVLQLLSFRISDHLEAIVVSFPRLWTSPFLSMNFNEIFHFVSFGKAVDPSLAKPAIQHKPGVHLKIFRFSSI
jgi:hypothetical protein